MFCKYYFILFSVPCVLCQDLYTVLVCKWTNPSIKAMSYFVMKLLFMRCISSCSFHVSNLCSVFTAKTWRASISKFHTLYFPFVDICILQLFIIPNLYRHFFPFIKLLHNFGAGTFTINYLNFTANAIDRFCPFISLQHSYGRPRTFPINASILLLVFHWK